MGISDMARGGCRLVAGPRGVDMVFAFREEGARARGLLHCPWCFPSGVDLAWIEGGLYCDLG
jgi:hypothetical protein